MANKEIKSADVQESLRRGMEIFDAANDLYFGVSNEVIAQNPELWEALRVAAHLETRDQLKATLAKEISEGKNVGQLADWEQS